MLNLKSVLYAITPENIRQIPLVKISLDIFVDYIMSSNEICQRISAVFDVDHNPDETDAQRRSRDILRKGVYLTWIYTLYNTLERLAVNTDVLHAIDKEGYKNAALLKGLDKVLTPETIAASRAFSQKVGTPGALRYMYHFGKYLETGEYSLDLEIDEGNPFIIHYEGSMNPAMFYSLVKPLAHPIGWIDSYERIMALVFHDYFGIEIHTSYDRIEFNNFNRWVVFIADNNKERVYEEFTNERINPETGKFYKRSEAEKLIEIFINKVPRSFDQVINDDGTIDRTIVFADDTVLLQQGHNPRWIKYTTYEDYVEGVQKPERLWGEDWIFYGSLSTNFIFLYHDDLTEFSSEYDFDGTGNTGIPGQKIEYISVAPENCFKIGGDQYPYMFGNDEQQFQVLNRPEVYSTLQRNFSTKFEYRMFRSGTITISDDFEHRYEYEIHYPNPDKWQYGEIALTTLGMQGFNYRVDIKEISGTHYWYRVTGLNQYNPAVEFNKVFTEQWILRVAGSCRMSDNKWQEPQHMLLTLTDSKGRQHTETVTEDGEFYFEIPIKKFAPGEYRIDLQIINHYGRIRHEAFYEGCDLWAYNDIEPWVTFLKYGTRDRIPDIEHQPLEHILQLEGTYSTADYITTRIGQRYDGSFCEPDSPVQDWIDPNYPRLPWDIEELDDKIIRGKYIEGSDYRNSWWYSDDYWDEETFIYKGFAHYPIDTPEFIIMDAQKYAWDKFDIEVISAHKGYYLFTEIAEDDYRGRYLYTADSCYLFTKEWYVKIYLETGTSQRYRYYIVDKRLRWKLIKDTLPSPEKRGYEFMYWSLSHLGTPIDNDYGFASDTVLYAVYRELPTEITITFDTQGGTSVEPMVLQNDIKLMFNDIKKDIGTTTRLDYDFVHWSLEPAGDPVDPYHRFSVDTILYAVWKIHHYEYRIVFEEEGGSTVPDIYVPDNVPFKDFMRLIFPPYRYGYNFVHWSLTPGGTSISPEWLAHESTRFYAVWANVAVVRLSFDSMGGTYVRAMEVDPTDAELPIPEKSGAQFMHWSLVPHGSPVDVSRLTGSRRLYAVYGN